MKRRDIIKGSIGATGALAALRAWGNEPCPPTLLGGSSSAPFCGSNATLPVGAFTQDAETPEQISLYAPITGTLGAGAFASVRYRAQGASTWRDAHPLIRINSSWVPSSAPINVVDAFAGTIFDLSPGLTYEVEVSISDGNGSVDIRRNLTFRTRNLPAAAGAATLTASPGSNLQSLINGLGPGDVLELSAGNYTLGQTLRLEVAGTPANPIYIRGADVDSVVISTSTDVMDILGSASNVVIENMTWRGRGIDDGSSQRCLVIPQSGVRNITVRDIRATGFDRALQVGNGESADGILVYNNVFEGNNAWTEEYISNSGPVTAWNDDGVRFAGVGNCAWNNTMSGFGDTFAVNHSVNQGLADCRANYIYRNRITNSLNDAAEMDYCVRNCAMYDNHVTNCVVVASIDPVYGGPLYIFRNVGINIGSRPYKTNTGGQSGWLMYNNTIVRSDSPPGHSTRGRGWMQGGSTEHRNIAYRNNILIFLGQNDPPSGNREIYRLRYNAVNDIDFTNNASYPDIPVQWEGDPGGAVFGSVRTAASSIRATNPMFPAGAGLNPSNRRHTDDIVVEADPFANSMSLGPDAVTEVTQHYNAVLAAGSGPKNAGVPIPNITDGYSGPAPDIGALIAGRGVPNWGADL